MRQLSTLVLLLILQACKHPLAIVGEGDIVDLNGNEFGCTLEQFQSDDPACQNDVEGDYLVNYSAVPRPGWVFSHWDGSCGHLSEEPLCRFDVGSLYVSFWDLTYGAVPIPELSAVFITEEQAAINDFFAAEIAEPVLEARCQACHVEGGLSGHTRLVFDHEDSNEQNQFNVDVLRGFVDSVDNGADYLLTKVRGGAAHGGGSVFSSGSQEYAALVELLDLIGDTTSTGEVPLGDFWSGVTFADSGATLRRAAILLTGREPTSEEYDLASSGETGLRQALRGLMQGEAFHEFLIRGANDRLLTDAMWLGGLNFDVIATPLYPALAETLHELRGSGNSVDGQLEENLAMGETLFGFARAPLELIAYIVENDRPYTEILTANYTMANRASAAAMRADEIDFPYTPEFVFSNHFLPAQNNGQVFWDDQYVSQDFDDLSILVIGHSGYLNYPHAGILSEPAFLSRYPSTETNRNRARARWTFYHFLGVDIEKAAGRTTDPVALADTNNPTLNNPNCAVCHQLHDPVAGAFQDFGDEGWYRSNGLDSLPDSYKNGAAASTEPESRIVLVYDGNESSDWLVWDAYINGVFANEGIGGCCPTAGLLDQSGTIRVSLNGTEVQAFSNGNLVNEGTIPEDSPELLGTGAIALYSFKDTSKRFDAIRVWDDSGATSELIFEDDFSGTKKSYWHPASGEWSFSDGEYVADGWGTSYLQLDALGVSGLKDFTVELDLVEATPGVGIWLRALPTPTTTDYRAGDLWYRDMRSPGISGQLAPQGTSSIQWLAEKITEDPRFATAAVKFWWPALMGVELTEAPEVVQDTDYQARLSRFEVQQDYVESLADEFITGIYSGSPYNLKDLLIEMMMSNWFRAQKVDQAADPLELGRFETVGVRRLLTPHELEEKTANLVGIRWNEYESPVLPEKKATALKNTFNLYYGDIDSASITERARQLTPLMVNVAQAHALQTACYVVVNEFNRPDEERQLFGGLERTMTPDTHAMDIRHVLSSWHKRLLGEELALNSAEIDADFDLLISIWNYRKELNQGEVWDPSFGEECVGSEEWRDEVYGDEWNSDPENMIGTWISMLIYFMTDFRYLHE